ncbi:hypothetical protein ACJZ2D_010108 [Fusarium nematophilum]
MRPWVSAMLFLCLLVGLAGAAASETLPGCIVPVTGSFETIAIETARPLSCARIEPRQIFRSSPSAYFVGQVSTLPWFETSFGEDYSTVSLTKKPLSISIDPEDVPTLPLFEWSTFPSPEESITTRPTEASSISVPPSSSSAPSPPRTQDTPSSSTTTASEPSGLSAGQIIGIVLGSVAGLVAIMMLILMALLHHRRRATPANPAGPDIHLVSGPFPDSAAAHSSQSFELNTRGPDGRQVGTVPVSVRRMTVDSRGSGSLIREPEPEAQTVASGEDQIGDTIDALIEMYEGGSSVYSDQDGGTERRGGPGDYTNYG